MGIFRQKALDKLQSPDQIDQVLRVIHRRSWIPLATLGGLLVVALFWSIFGRIPVTGRGNAIFIEPNSVVAFQAPGSGDLTSWHVKVGDYVRKGQILGILEQPTIDKQLDQARAKLAEAEARDEVLSGIKDRSNELEREALEQERANLVTQQANVRKSLDETENLGKELQSRVDSFERLRAEQLTSEDQLLQARRSAMDNELRLGDIRLQLKQLELSLIKVDNRRVQLDQRVNERGFMKRSEMADLRRNIDNLENQLQRNREIKADYDGRILELTAAEGSVINQGQRLGAIEARDESKALVALIYFAVKDGKQLHPDMKVRITPSTVQRARHGGIISKITSVSGFPVTQESAANYVGNSDVARGLTQGGFQIEVFAEMERDDTVSGYRWTSKGGPALKLTPGTTGDGYATIEERPPITFVIPVLREWTGI